MDEFMRIRPISLAALGIFTLGAFPGSLAFAWDPSGHVRSLRTADSAVPSQKFVFSPEISFCAIGLGANQYNNPGSIFPEATYCNPVVQSGITGPARLHFVAIELGTPFRKVPPGGGEKDGIPLPSAFMDSALTKEPTVPLTTGEIDALKSSINAQRAKYPYYFQPGKFKEDAAKIREPGAKIIQRLFHPPAEFVVMGVQGFPYGTLPSEQNRIDALARYMAAMLTIAREEGFVPDYFSPLNELDGGSWAYGASPVNYSRLIKSLRIAMNTNGFADVPIMPSFAISSWSVAYYEQFERDGTIASIGGITTNAYDFRMNKEYDLTYLRDLSRRRGLPFLIMEVTGRLIEVDGPDKGRAVPDTMLYASTLARHTLDLIRQGASTVVLWEAQDQPWGGDMGYGLLDLSGRQSHAGQAAALIGNAMADARGVYANVGEPNRDPNRPIINRTRDRSRRSDQPNRDLDRPLLIMVDTPTGQKIIAANPGGSTTVSLRMTGIARLSLSKGKIFMEGETIDEVPYFKASAPGGAINLPLYAKTVVVIDANVTGAPVSSVLK